MTQFTVEDVINTSKRWDRIEEWLEEQADIYTGERVNHFAHLDETTRSEPSVTFTVYSTKSSENFTYTLRDIVEATVEKTAARKEAERLRELADADEAARRAAAFVETAERRRLRELLEKYPDEATRVVIPAV